MGEGEKETGKGEKMDHTNNENSSDREGMIVGDKEFGLEDETEDKVETENELESLKPLLMALVTDWESLKEKMATKADFEAFKDIENKT